MAQQAVFLMKPILKKHNQMIFEHEIPTGSKLYFGESAKIKRNIESIASEMLSQRGFEEIVTPLFFRIINMMLLKTKNRY